MGWSYGTNAQGREVGYGVEAECDHPDCHEEIDRGLAYVCGGMHDGGEDGCGGYFCGSHRFLTGFDDPDRSDSPDGFLCGPCCDAWEAANLTPALLSPEGLEEGKT